MSCAVPPVCAGRLWRKRLGERKKNSLGTYVSENATLSVTKRVWFPDLGRSFSRSFRVTLPAPFPRGEGTYLWPRAGATGAQAGPHTRPRRGCRLWKEGGGGRDRCDPALQSAGQHAAPSSAQQWANSMVERKVEARRRFQQTGVSAPAAGLSREGAAAAASAAASAQPQGIYVPPRPGSRPFLCYFFPLRKHPRKGNERLQWFISADPSAENKEERSFQE